jgi:hypothetical protein
MEISKAAIASIAALCVTAGAAAVFVVTGAGQPGPIPANATLTAAYTEPIDAFQPVGTMAAPPAPAAPAAPVRTTASRFAPARRAAVRESAPAQRAWTQVPTTDEPAPPQRTSTTWTTTADPAPVRELEQSRTFDATPQFVELTVPEDSVLGLQIETELTSERASVEDEVVAEVTRDVRVDDRVAIPSGARAHGQVVVVERGGRLRERARLGIRFTSIALADGTRVPLLTDTIYREGSSPGGESAAKIGGGAIGGAIIGGILGGVRGAAIGGSVGAGAGSAAVMAGGRNAATLPAGTPITVRLIEPATVTVAY